MVRLDSNLSTGAVLHTADYRCQYDIIKALIYNPCALYLDIDEPQGGTSGLFAAPGSCRTTLIPLVPPCATAGSSYSYIRMAH